MSTPTTTSTDALRPARASDAARSAETASERAEAEWHELSAGHLELGPEGFTGSNEWRRMLRWLGAAVLVGVAAAFAFNVYVDPLGITSARRYKPQLVDGVNRVWMAELVTSLEQPPDLFFVGSSTGRNVDPAMAEELASPARAFNSSVSAGKPIDGFAFLSLVAERADEGAFPHVVWLVDVDGTFADAAPSPGLMRTPQLWRQFDRSERVHIARRVLDQYLSWHATKMSLTAVREGDRARGTIDPALAAFRPDGFRRTDPLRNADLEERLVAETARYRGSIYANENAAELDESARRWFERGIELANDHGDAPTIVVLPANPRMVEALEDVGRPERQDAVFDYLRSLDERGFEVEVVDMTDLATFSGDPAGFADHVHMTRANSNRMLERLAELGVLLPGARGSESTR